MTLLNSPIPISTERISLAGNAGEANVSLRMLPEPRIMIEGHFPFDLSRYFDEMKDDYTSLTFTDRAIDVPVLLTSSAFHDGRCTFTALPLERIVVGERSPKAVRVEFDVLNFPALRRRGPQTQDDADAEFRAGEWLIHLRSKSDVVETIKGLRESGGFAPTISGTLRRVDGGEFDYAAASEALTVLYNFLSFSRGFWTDLVLPVAFDRAGRKVWEEWGPRDSTPWRGIESLLPQFAEGAVMTEIFPGFWKRWQDPVWRKPLELAVYWYLGSNKAESGAEGSIMLTQNALELLAWNVLVKERRVLSASTFRSSAAADKIRILLHTAGIPLALPPELVELEKLRKKQTEWIDGPAVFVGFRNSIVHPGDKPVFLDASGEARVNAMNLGQWYIELTLLHVLGHTGDYRSRVAARNDRTQRVPWER
jgi:hypothetical protein